MLLTAAGDRAELLDAIAKGAVADANRFAHGLADRHGGVQDARRVGAERARGARRIVPARRRRRRCAALDRIARDFDAARAFAEPWDAHDLLAEIDAELAGAPPRRRRAPLAGVAPAAARRRRAAGAGTRCASSSFSARRSTRTPMRAQVVVPLRLRGGRGSRLVGIVLRHRLSRRARRFSRDAHALRRRRPRPRSASSLDYCVVDRVRPPSHALRCAGRVRAAEAARAAHGEEIPDAGCSSARAARRSRSSAAKRRPTSSSTATASSATSIGSTATTATGTVTVVDYKTGAIATQRRRVSRPTCARFASSSCRSTTGRAPRRATSSRGSRSSRSRTRCSTSHRSNSRSSPTSRAPRSRGATGEIGVAELERARDAHDRARRRARGGDARARSRRPTIPTPAATARTRDACRERPLALEERFGR